MIKYDKVVIKKSSNPKKKLMAVFSASGSSRTKTTHFGQAGAPDYTKTKDKERKRLYILRHRQRENWNAPTTAGALSRWVLWNKESRSASITDFKRRFNLK